MARTRDRSREHDVIVFGASGFTGELVAEYLLAHYGDSDLRIALAGRNEAKLEAVRERLGVVHPKADSLPILMADSFDKKALKRLAESTEVICTTVGPYAKYGEPLVEACVDRGTDYCDLTGETPFIRRIIDRYHDAARESGARIVCCCGFDSIPSDLGTLMVQEAMHERYGAYANEVRYTAGRMGGALSGGTVASMLNIVDQAKRDRDLRSILLDPYALNPPGDREGPDGRDQSGVRYDDDLQSWTGPFMMAAINTRVVRRTHALMGHPWGRSFRYAESQSFGAGAKGFTRAAAVAAGTGAFIAAASSKGLRGLMERRLPKPGEGPSREARERGFFECHLVARGRTPEGRSVQLRGLVAGQQDPGYGETAKMLGEAARCLSIEAAELGTEGGILTPAYAMGMRLTNRLRDAGMTFSVSG